MTTRLRTALAGGAVTLTSVTVIALTGGPAAAIPSHTVVQLCTAETAAKVARAHDLKVTRQPLPAALNRQAETKAAYRADRNPDTLAAFDQAKQDVAAIRVDVGAAKAQVAAARTTLATCLAKPSITQVDVTGYSNDYYYATITATNLVPGTDYIVRAYERSGLDSASFTAVENGGAVIEDLYVATCQEFRETRNTYIDIVEATPERPVVSNVVHFADPCGEIF